MTSAVESTGTNGTPRTGVYTVTPPGGSWDSGDNGTYTIGMVGNQVSDDGTPQLFVPADTSLTTFEVSINQPAAAPVGHWTLDNNALDSSGNNNNGTTNGTTFTTDSRIGSHAA